MDHEIVYQFGNERYFIFIRTDGSISCHMPTYGFVYYTPKAEPKEMLKEAHRYLLQYMGDSRSATEKQVEKEMRRTLYSGQNEELF